MKTSYVQRAEVVNLWRKQKRKNITAISRKTGRTIKYIKKWVGRWQRTKDVLDSNRSGRKKKLTTELLETVKKIIQKQGGKSPKLAAIELHRQLGVKISPQTVRRRFVVRRLGGQTSSESAQTLPRPDEC